MFTFYSNDKCGDLISIFEQFGRVYVVVRCEVVEPYPDRPTEGFFVFNTEFSPMASASFEVGARYHALCPIGCALLVLRRALTRRARVCRALVCLSECRKRPWRLVG